MPVLRLEFLKHAALRLDRVQHGNDTPNQRHCGKCGEYVADPEVAHDEPDQNRTGGRSGKANLFVPQRSVTEARTLAACAGRACAVRALTRRAQAGFYMGRA